MSVQERVHEESVKWVGKRPMTVAEFLMDIVPQKAVHGAPDLVLEVISPGDRPSDLIALETDYRLISVPEIVFVDQRKRETRVLRARQNAYVDEVVTRGPIVLESLGVLGIETDWLVQEPRPGIRATVDLLLAQATDVDSDR